MVVIEISPNVWEAQILSHTASNMVRNDGEGIGDIVAPTNETLHVTYLSTKILGNNGEMMEFEEEYFDLLM